MQSHKGQRLSMNDMQLDPSVLSRLVAEGDAKCEEVKKIRVGNQKIATRSRNWNRYLSTVAVEGISMKTFVGMVCDRFELKHCLTHCRRHYAQFMPSLMPRKMLADELISGDSESSNRRCWISGKNAISKGKRIKRSR